MSASEGKNLTFPGEVVSESPLRTEGCFIDSKNNKTYASVISISQEGKVIPLKGYYLPRYGDYIIGIIKEERFSGYVADLNSPYEGSISNRELREELKIGDIISAEIIAVNETNEATLSKARKFSGGDLIEIDAVKVPRVIGRNSSMLTILKESTGSEIFVGKNGRIYIRGGNTALATLAVLKICREAHTSGLTDRMQTFLKENYEEKK